MVIRFIIVPKKKKKPTISTTLRRQCTALTKSCGCVPGKVNEAQKAFILHTDGYALGRLVYWFTKGSHSGWAIR